MSDEENKAIEYWKTHMEILHWNTQLASEYYIKILLNLIDKQQKEIEELKNGQIDFWISDKEIEERIRNKFVNKDKIKAKIEGIDKVLNKDIYVIDGHYDDRYYRYLQDKQVLQSLLEEE